MYKKRLLALFCTMLPLLSLPAPAVAENASKVVAKVGSISVTEDDVQRELQKRIPMQVSFHGGMKAEKLEKIRNEAKEAVIVRAYKVQYALEKELSVEGKVVDAEWNRVLAKNPGLSKATEQQKEGVKAALYLDLLAQKAEEEAVGKKVVVTDDEIKAYYAKNKEQYFQPKLFKASHIFIKVDPSDSAEVKEAKRQKAEKLLERAKAGEDFYNLAYYESDDRSRYVGGSLGSFHAGQLTRELDAALQQLKVGEVAGPVMTLYGYHVIRLDDVQPERQLTFEQAAEKIRAKLAEEKRKKLYEEWMNGLRQKYPLQENAS